MLAVLPITGTIFALIALGYSAVRIGFLEPAAVRALGGFVVTLALPALVFRAVTSGHLGATLDAGYLLGYLIGSVAVFSLGYLWSRRARGLGPAASTFRGMGMSCPNSGFIGYPILLMTMPAIAGPALALSMIVENLALIPLCLVMAERARSRGVRGPALALQVSRRVATNPIMLALVAALSVTATGIALPAFLTRAIDLLAQSSAAVSLVVIGGTLVGAGGGALARTTPMVFGKLILHPLAVGGTLLLLPRIGVPVAPELLWAGLIIAATPPMGIYPILAQQYGEGRDAAAAMLATTVVSFATISALLWLIGAGT